MKFLSMLTAPVVVNLHSVTFLELIALMYCTHIWAGVQVMIANSKFHNTYCMQSIVYVSANSHLSFSIFSFLSDTFY